MSADRYAQDFEEAAKSLTWWKKFTGSQFVKGIALFVGMMLDRAVFAANRAHQESFLSTAKSRASILAAAEDKGYIPTKRFPSKGLASLVNKSDIPRAVPLNSQLVSSSGLIYTVRETLEIPANSTVSVEIEQIQKKLLQHTVGVTQKYYEVLLDRDTSLKVSELNVIVSANTTSYWVKTFQFRRTTSQTPAYTEVYKPSDQLGVRFGNGINGRKVEEGQVVYLEAWTTEGDSTLVADQALSWADGNNADLAEIKATTKTSIVGGQEQESIEEIRRGALYATTYDNQIVWDEDYIYYLDANLSNLSWLNVWGEQEQEAQAGAPNVEFTNRIYISVHSPDRDQATLKAEVDAIMDRVPLFNRRPTYVPSVPRGYAITLTGKTYEDKTPANAIAQISSALKARYGKEAEPIRDETGKIINFTGIKSKQLWAFVDALQLLDDFELTVEGATVDIQLSDFLYLDVTTSSFNIT